MHTILEDKKTPLYEIHKALGARLVTFAGWQMPVLYSGVIEEHLAVRSSAGLFDVSHMGEIEVSGKGAHRFVQRLITNDVDRAGDGQCLYALLCYPDGGVVDDVIVYRYNKDRFLFCVNASNVSKVHEWFILRRRARAFLSKTSARITRSLPCKERLCQGHGEAHGCKRLGDKDIPFHDGRVGRNRGTGFRPATPARTDLKSTLNPMRRRGYGGF